MMNKHFKKSVKILILVTILSGLLTTPSFAAEANNILIKLRNGIDYNFRLAGLFYREPGASAYQQAGSWLAPGAQGITPVVPKGSKFCVSIGLPGSLYDNYYFNSDGHAPDWTNEPIGYAYLNFYGRGGEEIKWEFVGPQTAGLTYESTRTGQGSACNETP